MTTNEIIDILFEGSKELHIESKGYKCQICLYKCNLSRNDVYNLFNFEVDDSLSAFNPRSSISIPEGEIKEIYKHDEKYNQDKLSYMMKIFPEDIIKQYGKELTYVVFSILHEVGHWMYICNKNYSPQEFKEKDSLERKNFYKENGNDDSEEAFWRYREITSEKAADKYAIIKLNDALEAIVNDKRNKYER